MKLETYLQKNKQTIRSFAKLIGVSEFSVYRYITGRTIPAERIMILIIKVTNGKVKPNDFYDIEGILK